MTTKAQNWYKKCLNKGLPEEVSHILCTPRSWEAQAPKPRALQSNYQILRLYNKCVWWITLTPFYKALGWEWLIAQLKWLLIYDKWTTPVTFWLQLLFWDELTLSFLRRVDCIKFPKKMGKKLAAFSWVPTPDLILLLTTWPCTSCS